MSKFDDLTLGDVKELKAMLGGGDCGAKRLPFTVGESYLIRTVTHIDVGEVESIVGDFVVLKTASWIADTGRYHDCLVKGVFSEVEPYPAGVAVNSAAIIDRAPWPHELPTVQK